MTPIITFNTSTLNAISLRLAERADQIQQVTLADLAHDIRLASQVCDKLASLRFRIGEIAEQALHQDGGATARDLRELLDCHEGE
jgi:hypothetical protein